MLIFDQLLPRFSCWRLVVVVVVGFLLSSQASHRHCCIVHGGGGVPPHRFFLLLSHLIVVVVFSILSSLLAICCSRRRRRPLLGCFCWLWNLVIEVIGVSVSLLSLFCCCQKVRSFLWMCPSASAPHCRCRCCQVFCPWRLLVVVVVVVGSLIVGGVLSLSSASALLIYLKILVYITLTMHATNIDPQHQVQKIPAVIQGVWLLYLVLSSPQSKLTYPFVSKFQKVIGTNREAFEIILALLFLQQVPVVRNRCTFALADGLSGRFIFRY